MTMITALSLNNIQRVALSALLISSLCVGTATPAAAQSAFNDPGTATATGGAVPDLVAVSPTVDAGAVTLGSSSQVVMLYRNDDTKPINIGDISLYPSSNVSASIAENKCTQEPLAPSAVCAIAFSVKGLQAGRFRIEILLRHDGRARLLTSSISGSVDAAADGAGARNNDIELLPTEVDFGTLTASRTQIVSVLLRNITSQEIEVKEINVQASAQAGYTVNHDCGKLNSGGACVVSVGWTPQQIGPARGALLIDHTGPTGRASVPIKGEYTPATVNTAPLFADAVPGKGLLVSSANEVNYGPGIEKSSSITVSLVNAGDTALTIKDIRLTNKENGLKIDRSGCSNGRVLNPIEACPMTLTWAPVRTGAILDDITVEHTGARGILVLPVRGAATKVVSKDSSAINMSDFNGVPRLSLDDIGEDDASSSTSSRKSGSASAKAGASAGEYRVPDVRGVLDGYSISSLAANRAVVAGIGGSRVITDGETTVIGGVPWVVSVKSGAVQFTHNNQSIIMLFDRSLSFINSDSAQSGSVNLPVSSGAQTSADEVSNAGGSDSASFSTETSATASTTDQ